jgi:hypothetical protein
MVLWRRRSLPVVSRWIAVGGLCAALGLSACGQGSSSGTSGASAVTSPAGASTIAVTGSAPVQTGDPRPTPPGGAGSIAGGSPAGPTRPEIRPQRGFPSTVFIVRLTSRVRLGASGFVGSEYRLSSTGPSAPACDREATSTIVRGTADQRLRVVLRPGPMGWCRGYWRGVVLLERGPACTKGPGGVQSRRCPEFASQLIEVGRFTWRVR